MSIIKVKNLSKSYEYYKKKAGLMNSIKSLFHREILTNEAVKGIDFEIQPGEMVGFLGPNGAGKTTTLKILSGIIYPTSGEAKVMGYIPSKRQIEFQKKFAIVMGMKSQLWWDLPAMETFLLNKEIYDVTDKQFKKNLDELTTLMQIENLLEIPVRKLSLGERMKCELVAALLHNPKVLFLDEPTIGLDVISQNNIRSFLKKYNRKQKTTIILTSHYMEDIESLCKRVIIINHGSIVYDGQLQKLLDKYIDSKLIDVTFSEKVEKNKLAKIGKIKERTAKRVVIEVEKDKSRQAAVELLNNYPVEDILINEIAVEDVIRKIFSK